MTSDMIGHVVKLRVGDTLQVGFLMDGVQRVRNLRRFAPDVKSTITYVDDPQFFQFADGVKVFGGNTLVIEVSVIIFESYKTCVNLSQSVGNHIPHIRISAEDNFIYVVFFSFSPKSGKFILCLSGLHLHHNSRPHLRSQGFNACTCLYLVD